MEDRNLYPYEAPRIITYNDEKGSEEFGLSQTRYIRGKNALYYAIEDQRKEVRKHVMCSF
ncbi:hypothetical protein MTYM_02356 [Methylococcales bacterium]|nr:hypothetical protein MTYM_02356 [Methylococcales bacterium]